MQKEQRNKSFKLSYIAETDYTVTSYWFSIINSWKKK